MEKSDIIDNKAKQRYELDLGSDVAYMEYRIQNNTKVLMHTYVPEKYRGKGNANKLIQQVLDDLRKNRKKVMINCPSVTRFLKENPDYNEVVLKFKPAALNRRKVA